MRSTNRFSCLDSSVNQTPLGPQPKKNLYSKGASLKFKLPNDNHNYHSKKTRQKEKPYKINVNHVRWRLAPRSRGGDAEGVKEVHLRCTSATLREINDLEYRGIVVQLPNDLMVSEIDHQEVTAKLKDIAPMSACSTLTRPKWI